VIADPSSEATKATTLAISAGVAIRPSGIDDNARRSASSGLGCVASHSSTSRVRV